MDFWKLDSLRQQKGGQHERRGCCRRNPFSTWISQRNPHSSVFLFLLHVRMVSTSSIKTSSPGTLRWTITEILSLMNCSLYFLNVRKNWKRRCYRMKRKREILGIQPLVLETSGEFLAVS